MIPRDYGRLLTILRDYTFIIIGSSPYINELKREEY